MVIGLGASACGQISFGDPLDAGMAVVEDTGPLDSGMVVPDVGPMDLGCTPPVRPPLPSSWPYPATKTGYLENFYNNLPEPDGCGLKSCHGPDPDEFDQPANTPLIVADPAELDRPGVLDQAILELWATMTPEGTSPLLQVHVEGAPGYVDNTGGDFDDDEIAYLTTFVARSYQCAWKDYVPPSQDAGVRDTGAGDATPSDGPIGSDGGDAGPGADAAPVDTGPAETPVCPVTVDTSYCAN